MGGERAGRDLDPIASLFLNEYGSLLRRVNVTEPPCWLATAWTPVVVVPGATKLRVVGTGVAGAFAVLSNMRPSSDSRRVRSLGGMGMALYGGDAGFRSKHRDDIGRIGERLNQILGSHATIKGGPCGGN